MPQIDNFITQQTPTSNIWTLSDGWIASGGRWCYLEFSNTRLGNGRWFAAQNPNLSSDSGTVISTEIKSVHYENRGSETVVYVACELSRVVDRSEVITVNTSTPASTGSQFAAVTASTVIRNYANCDSNGGASFALRAGGSANTKKTDPSTVTGNRTFMLRAEDATASQINVGVWDGGTSRLNAEAGGMVLNASNPDFNSQATVQLSTNFLGSIPGYYTNPNEQNDILYIVVFRPVGTAGQFHFCHTEIEDSGGGGGGPIDPINAVEITEVPIGGGIRLFTNVPLGQTPPENFTSRDYWSVFHESDNSRTKLNVDSSQETDFKLGNLSTRVCVAAVRWNGTTTTFYTYNGHELGKVDVTSGNIPDLPLGSGTGQYDFFGVRTDSNAIDVAEVYCYETLTNNAYSDKTIAEYLAFLDNKYNTNAQQFFVDISAGSDSNSGTQASPYLTLDKALERVAFGAGDHVLFNAGTTQALSEPLSVYPVGNTNAALGYSPDYPFVVGYYGTRSTGRVEHEFGYTVGKYVDIYGKSINVAIDGHKFFSPQRNPVDPNYVGFASLAAITSGEGYGIYYNWNPELVYSPDSIQIIDCEITDSARHGVSFRAFSDQTTPVFPSQFKFSSVRRTQIHDLFNVYSTSNADHEPQEGNFGVAGIYSEGIGGLHMEDDLFFRCGWVDRLEITGVSGATLGENATSAVDSELLALASEYEDSDIFRAEIVNINGGATSGSYLTISYITGTTIAFREVPPEYGLMTGDVIDFVLVDGAPRNAACADVVINGISTGNNDVVHHRSWGPYSLVNNIHVEASGYTVLSDASYLTYNSVIESNFYGLAMSPEYTYVDQCFFGASLAETDEMRRSPGSRRDSHYTGRVQTGHYAARHAWQIYFSDSVGNVFADIQNNIFHYPDETNIQGTNNFNADSPYNRFYPSCFVWLDERNSGSIYASMTFNTMYSLPGSMVIAAGSNPSDTFSINRNILQHDTDYPLPFLAGELFYTFENPFTGNFSDIATLQVGQFNNYSVTGATEGDTRKSIKFETQTSLVDTPTNPNAIDAFEWNFAEWREDTNDLGTYGSVDFITSARSIITYNGMSLGINQTQVNFATTAISVHASGWSEAYSADRVNEHIRYSFTPTNLSEDTYGNDYIGAVEFSSIGTTFAAYYTLSGSFFGFGV